MKLRLMVGGLVIFVAGCGTGPEPVAVVDHYPALVAACPNAEDDTPWLVVVDWDDGDQYRQITRFEADGGMAYAYEGDNDFDDERWAVSGSSLTLEMNDGYVHYTGTFDGVRGKGTVKNIENNTGVWVMTRDCNG